MRAVLDVNVLVSALLSRYGAPAQLLRAWHDGAFELVVSPKLLDELGRALAYPKVGARIGAEEAALFVAQVRASSTESDDSGDAPPTRSRDPGDDYLIALAAMTRSILVTDDTDLLDLRARAPVMSPRDFLERLDT